MIHDLDLQADHKSKSTKDKKTDKICGFHGNLYILANAETLGIYIGIKKQA
jgi:hypothetical protein